jgi:hypothetical protein
MHNFKELTHSMGVRTIPLMMRPGMKPFVLIFCAQVA